MAHPNLEVSYFQPFKIISIVILGSLFELLQNCIFKELEINVVLVDPDQIPRDMRAIWRSMSR